MKDKIFIINDDCIWRDESCSNIVSVTNDKDIAIKLLKDYVKKVKEEVEFDSLDAIEDSPDLDYGEHEYDWIYSESDTNFELFQCGEYNSNHISINIEVRDLIKEYINEEELCH